MLTLCRVASGSENWTLCTRQQKQLQQQQQEQQEQEQHAGRGSSQLSQFPAVQAWGIRRMWWTWWRHMLHNICICNEGGHCGSSVTHKDKRTDMQADSSRHSCPNSDKYEYQYGNILEFLCFMFFFVFLFFRISFALNWSIFAWRRRVFTWDLYLEVSLVSKVSDNCVRMNFKRTHRALFEQHELNKA